MTRAAFISYVHEDRAKVDEISNALGASGIATWRDTQDLWPGQDWRARIRHILSRESTVFLACFSRNSARKSSTYMNEELILAIEKFRLMRSDEIWLIPIRLDDCELPTYSRPY